MKDVMNLMPAIQKIVLDKQAQKVDGVMLDMFTASVIVKAYDQVNNSNKAVMEKADINFLVNCTKVNKVKDVMNEYRMKISLKACIRFFISS